MELRLRVAHLLRHGRKSDTLGQIGKRINEASLLSLFVIERASVTELARARFFPVFARNGLIVGVDRAEGSLTEILGQRLN